ncbi:MAG: zf-HC2 domain-containing protein [Planctomycetes bacterium]|nr:zf-HC2 domain-containing protein [Planctomycetota bacterium]
MRIISKNKGPQGRNNPNGDPNKCRRIRTWLYRAVNSRLGIDANWVQNHIAGCPRCRRRLAAAGKVNLALSALKAQPHRIDLLMRANSQTIGVLKHSLRQAPKAAKLKAMLPQPTLLERWRKYAHSVANLAACITIVLLMKVGVFSSMGKFQTEGQKVVKQYYASQVGQDLANEVFTT